MEKPLSPAIKKGNGYPREFPVSAPAQRFHSDITYIPTQEGFLYLAATVDAFTRRCSGWCARDNMESQLVKDAARMAFGDASILNGLHHSDRGSQYASEAFRLLLEKEQILQSMSRKGNCYDNALSESLAVTMTRQTGLKNLPFLKKTIRAHVQ